MEIRVVQEIKKLRPELKFLALGDANVLERREIPIGITRPLRDVASRRPELLHGRVGILRDSLEGARIEPCARSARTRVGILSGNQVRPVGEESGDFRGRALDREIGGIEDGKRRTAPVSYTHLRAHETVLDLVCRLLLE